MYRPRQEQKGDYCGALILVISQLQDCGFTPTIKEEDDQQMKLEKAFFSTVKEHMTAVALKKQLLKRLTKSPSSKSISD
jgi:hypothetical protein